MITRSQSAFRAEAVSRAPRQRARRGWRRPAALFCCAGLLAATASPQGALASTVILNTSSLANLPGRLEFDLLDNDGVANNSVVVSNIASNGTFVGTDCSVGCTGGPTSFVLSDAIGLGQLLYDLTLVTSLSFDLSYTTNFGGLAGTDPDRFKLNLLDSGTNFTLVGTNLLPPSDALLAIDLVGSGVVQTASLTNPIVGLAVPEPGSLALTAVALLALVGRRAVGAFRTSISG